MREHWGRLTNDQMCVIAGRHNRLAGRAQEEYGERRWHKLTNVDVIAGNRAQLTLNIQDRYGITREESEKQLSTGRAVRKRSIVRCDEISFFNVFLTEAFQ